MKNLNSQLNNLKNVKPNSEWKFKNRDFLVAQIYNTTETKPADFSFSFFSYAREYSYEVLSIVSQPAMIVGLVFVFLLGGGLYGATASRSSKPGDSLYVAKMISEKTQMALTFDEKEKVQLRIDFAGNRAEEIDQVLAATNENNDEKVKNEKKEKVDELVVNMKKEIGAAKSSLQKISKNANIDIKVEEKTQVNSKNNTKPATKTKKEEDEVFSANISKQEKGISTTDKADTGALRKEVKKEIEDSRALLSKARESLRSDDVAETLSTLEKVDEAIDKTVDEGEVKGVEEKASASTTEEKK